MLTYQGVLDTWRAAGSLSLRKSPARVRWPNAKYLGMRDIKKRAPGVLAEADLETSPTLAVSIRQACRLTGLSRSTLYNYARKGQLKLLKAGRRTLILPAELERFLIEITSSAKPIFR